MSEKIKKILITGMYSRLGTRIREQARGRCSVAGVARESRDPQTSALDIADGGKLREVVAREKPDCVIHAAALTDVDLCEKEPALAMDVNARGSRYAAEACREAGAKLVHVSTDYVFDGEAGPYAEDAVPRPINHYGKSKLEGEKAVLSACPDALIVRTCVPYDWNPAAKPNFLTWLIQKLESKSEIKIVTDQWNTPTFMPHLAQTILELAEKNASGIFNVCGREFLSRYDFVEKACGVFGFDLGLVKKSTSALFKQIAARPPKGGLTPGKTESFLGRKLISLEEGLQQSRDLYRKSPPR